MGKKSHDCESVYRYMNDLVGELCDLLGKALKEGDEDAVHDARVTTRRLTAAIRLLEPVVSDDYRKPFAKGLKSIRRKLGPLRDLDVMIGHLVEFKTKGRHADAVEWLTVELEHERDGCRERASGETAGKTLRKIGCWLALEDEVHDAEPGIKTLLADAIARQATSFGIEADRLASNWVSDASADGRSPDGSQTAQDPHELRITGKELRYSLELAIVAGIPLPKSSMMLFKRLQDSLGLWHDYVVLADKALRTALDRDMAVHRPAIFAEVMAMAQVIWRQAHKHLAQFSAAWGRSGQALLRQILDVLPVALDPTPVPLELPVQPILAQNRPQLVEASERSP